MGTDVISNGYYLNFKGVYKYKYKPNFSPIFMLVYVDTNALFVDVFRFYKDRRIALFALTIITGVYTHITSDKFGISTQTNDTIPVRD